LRWQKFAGHLAEAGIGVDAVTLDPTELASQDRTRLNDLPPGTRVFGVRQPRLVSERLEQSLLRARRILQPPRRPTPPAAAGAPTPAGSPRIDSYSRADILRGTVPGSRLARAWHARQDLARVEAWARAAARVGRAIIEPGRHRMVISCGPPHQTHEGARQIAERTGFRW
jgi:hypothetical protein